MVYLDAPMGGKKPDYSATAAYPELYHPETGYGPAESGIIWYDSEGYNMDPNDTFVEGETYKVEIKLVPTQLGGADVCKFAKTVAGYINGEQVIELPDWDAVYASEKVVYLNYTFADGAAVPKIFRKQPQSVSVAVDAEPNITWETSFVPKETEIQYWDGQAWVQKETWTPQGMLDGYDFKNPEAGNCFMKFRIAAQVNKKTVIYSQVFPIAWGEVLSHSWSGDDCTVTIETVGGGIVAMVVSYEGGKLSKVEYLTLSDPTAIVSGDRLRR